jgi:hypothetical protein
MTLIRKMSDKLQFVASFIQEILWSGHDKLKFVGQLEALFDESGR